VFAGRRFVLNGAIAAVVWFACILVFWAFQPLSDSVPVGIDYTLKTPARVSVSVDCNSLFDSRPRDDSPLPALKAQPPGNPPLAFQREPCVIVHDQAQIVFILDTAVFALVASGFVWFVVRKRRSSVATQLRNEASLAVM
jgi:hypothetical protein